jgi:hypothetical protein
MAIIKLDNTRRTTFTTCKRKYYYSYKKGYKSQYGSTALRYGTVWHAMKEGYYKVVADKGWNTTEAVSNAIIFGKKAWEEESSRYNFIDDYRTLENALLSFAMWVEHFVADEGFLKVVEPEVPFRIKVNLTDEEKEHFPYLKEHEVFFTGKIDLEVQLGGRYWITEDKTTGQNISIQSERLQRSPQLIGYVVAGNVLLPTPPEGVLVTFHQLTARKSTKTGLYGEPKIDFSRVPQIFTERDLSDWRVSFLDKANEIALEEQRGLWPKEFNSCYNYNRRCEYYNLCSQNVPLGEEYTENLHMEEPWDVLKGEKPREGEM